MSGPDLTSTPAGGATTPSVSGLPLPLEPRNLAPIPLALSDTGSVLASSSTIASAPAPAASRPTVRIARRSRIPPWKNPHPLNPAAAEARLIIGKSRGLFLRDRRMRFRERSAQAERAAETRPKTRKTRRWEPVLISPVFPRGPLVAPLPWPFRERRRHSIRTCREQPVRRNRFRTPDRDE
jgi:hypothetical protein